ncbi:hypothetical protein ABZW26_04415 [Streptomyces sp. NPDC004623]|uniref:hypothetical protein n=1 Tax=Streptomyces sp. NPDC004623 TaxID=3156653 RepID=UPI0033B7781D
MPAGERVAGVGEVGADDAQMLVGEVGQPPRDVRVGYLAGPSWKSAVAVKIPPNAARIPSWAAVSSIRASAASSVVLAS